MNIFTLRGVSNCWGKIEEKRGRRVPWGNQSSFSSRESNGKMKSAFLRFSRIHWSSSYTILGLLQIRIVSLHILSHHSLKSLIVQCDDSGCGIKRRFLHPESPTGDIFVGIPLDICRLLVSLCWQVHGDCMIISKDGPSLPNPSSSPPYSAPSSIHRSLLLLSFFLLVSWRHQLSSSSSSTYTICHPPPLSPLCEEATKTVSREACKRSRLSMGNPSLHSALSYSTRKIYSDLTPFWQFILNWAGWVY